MLILQYVLPFVAVIAVLVTVHEWGHYHAARTLGIQVTAFSIGMGKTVWSRTDRNGCVWRIGLLPIGGYVKFLGDADGSSASADPGVSRAASAMSAAERRRYFHLRSPGDRAFVIAAGPVVNLLLGVAVLAGLYATAGRSYVPPVVHSVVAGMPAEKAGVKEGDRILEVNGSPVSRFSDVIAEISLYPGSRVVLKIERDESGRPAEHTYEMTAVASEERVFGMQQSVGKIGIGSGPLQFEPVGAVDGLKWAVGDVYSIVKQNLVALGQIVTGRRSLDEAGGPVKMGEIAGNAAAAGPGVFMLTLAILSINLGVINLFPVPVLDGGQLVVCVVEALTRRPVSERVLAAMHKAGAAVLIALMAILTANDLLGILASF